MLWLRIGQQWSVLEGMSDAEKIKEPTLIILALSIVIELLLVLLW